MQREAALQRVGTQYTLLLVTFEHVLGLTCSPIEVAVFNCYMLPIATTVSDCVCIDLHDFVHTVDAVSFGSCLRATLKAHLPMAFQGAKLTDLHATRPAFLSGRPSACFAGHNQLCLRVTMKAQTFKFIKQHVLATCCLHHIGSLVDSFLIKSKASMQEQSYTWHGLSRIRDCQ